MEECKPLAVGDTAAGHPSLGRDRRPSQRPGGSDGAVGGGAKGFAGAAGPAGPRPRAAALL